MHAEFKDAYERCLRELPVDRSADGLLHHLMAEWLEREPVELRAERITIWVNELREFLCERRILCMCAHEQTPRGTQH